jgi:hypothetical protein
MTPEYQFLIAGGQFLAIRVGRCFGSKISKKKSKSKISKFGAQNFEILLFSKFQNCYAQNFALAKPESKILPKFS